MEYEQMNAAEKKWLEANSNTAAYDLHLWCKNNDEKALERYTNILNNASKNHEELIVALIFAISLVLIRNAINRIDKRFPGYQLKNTTPGSREPEVLAAAAIINHINNDEVDQAFEFWLTLCEDDKLADYPSNVHLEIVSWYTATFTIEPCELEKMSKWN